MKSVLYHDYDPSISLTDNSDDITCFLDTIKYDVGNHILLVGKIGDLGKRLRRLGVYVTILEDSPYEDVCYSLIHNGNCNVIKGTLELIPFEDKYFDKVIVLDNFNNTGDFRRASEEINRVLKTNGELILEDLNLKNIKVKLKNLKHKLCGEHVKYHYPDDVEEIFSKLDFEGNVKEVESERYIYIGKRK